jgi:hypothetical protein
MIRNLAEIVPPENMRKLRTIDGDASDIQRDLALAHFDLAFIDGEHTNRAAFNDFLAVRPWMKPDSIIAFHDAGIVFDALDNIISMLKFEQIRFRYVMLPDSVFAILFGNLIDSDGDEVASRGRDWREYVVALRKWLNREIAASVAAGH